MEQAIKKAIEGGYDEHKFDGAHISRDEGIAIVTSDPTFWQCLGKAGILPDEIPTNDIYGKSKIYKPWLEEWHRFIDHLAEGKSADEFFNEFLK